MIDGEQQSRNGKNSNVVMVHNAGHTTSNLPKKSGAGPAHHHALGGLRDSGKFPNKHEMANGQRELQD